MLEVAQVQAAPLKRLFAFLIVLFAAAAPAAVAAETLTGRVVAVADGDTITVLDAVNQQYKVRLSGIDAPEKSQPFGQRSKQHLSELAFNRQVTVEWDKLDRYGRTVGKVMVNGVDANLEQIKAGMAWWYENYRKEQSVVDQQAYAEAEEQARAQKIGLWRDPVPVEPWVWRKKAKD